ncbi:MAG: EFR1 family ferrodoxin [Lachnospiraceae bacterium]
MIFYFSGTGNSKWVAEQLAQKIEDTAYNIFELDDTIDISNAKKLGFVFPIYAWGMPVPMESFIKNLKKQSVFTFAICTCGEDAGYALKNLSNYYPLDSSYSLAMPNNYLIGSDLEDSETVLNKIRLAKKEIQIISNEILKEQKTYHVHEGRLAALKSSFIHKGFLKFACSTKPFYTTDSCNGCGLCAKSCPASIITLNQNKPRWNGTCFQCLRCIHECPKTAIQYGKNTEKRKRYTIDKYRKEI